MHLIKLITILLLPLLLTACARAEGAIAPTGVAGQAPTTDYSDQIEVSYLPDVEATSLAPIIDYVDGLNLALTGEFEYIKTAATPNCGCLDIANRIATLLKTATLIGGHYQLASIKVIKDGVAEKSFQVIVHRSDLRKIDKASKQSVIWSKSEIKNQFIVKNIDGGWLLSDIK
ncbi:MAG: hypothetical protein NTV41_02650 [Actinobacteria bacterium]|nr:hypothetical protein [Actinomycetota bacterium]